MPDVAVILGSKSDLATVQSSKLLSVLDDMGVSWELSAISAHRNPSVLKQYCLEAVGEHGTKVFIGIAGMTPALPGAIAGLMVSQAWYPRLVIGVTLSSSTVNARDTEPAITRMPPGVPVCYAGADKAGLHNAGLLACQVLSIGNEGLATQLRTYIHENIKPAEIGLPTSTQGA